MRRRIQFLALAAVLATSGCESGGPSISAFFSFLYSGYASGSFSAQGALNEQSSSGVTGGVSDGSTVILGITTSGTVSTLAFAVFPTTASGEHAMTQAECDPETEPCYGVMIWLTEGSGENVETVICLLTSGTMNITTSTTQQAAGSFSGSGDCVDFADTSVGTITMTQGAFSSQLSAEPPLAGPGGLGGRGGFSRFRPKR